MGNEPSPQKDDGGMIGGRAVHLSTWGFSGRRGHAQKKFRMSGSCELQLQFCPGHRVLGL